MVRREETQDPTEATSSRSSEHQPAKKIYLSRDYGPQTGEPFRQQNNWFYENVRATLMPWGAVGCFLCVMTFFSTVSLVLSWRRQARRNSNKAMMIITTKPQNCT